MTTTMKPFWVWRTHPSPSARMTEFVYDEGATSKVRSRRTGKRRTQGVELACRRTYCIESGRSWPTILGKPCGRRAVAELEKIGMVTHNHGARADHGLYSQLRAAIAVATNAPMLTITFTLDEKKLNALSASLARFAQHPSIMMALADMQAENATRVWDRPRRARRPRRPRPGSKKTRSRTKKTAATPD